MNLWRFFLNEILLFGALAALLPLLLHLLLQTTSRTEVWGAMMFLQESLKSRARALRLQQWLLLLLRALFFICLALALARPIITPNRLHGGVSGAGSGAIQPPTTHVLILDISYSMMQGGRKNTLFDRATASARQILDTLGENDDVLLILAGQKPRPVLRKPSSDIDFLRRKLDELAPGYEKADLPLACEQALRLLSESTRAKRRIYVLTDGQRVSWREPDDPRWQDFARNYALQKIPPQLYVLCHPPENPPQNTLIRGIYSAAPLIDMFRVNRFMVEIENFGEPRRIRVDFFVNGKPSGEREVDLPTGRRVVNFDCSFDKPGSHYVAAEIPPDTLPADNRHVLAVNVLQRLPVLIIEGNSFEDPFASDAALFNTALTAAAGAGDETLIVPSLRNQADLDRLDSAYLARFKLVALVNVRSLSSLVRARLERYVRQGGGLLLALGGDVSIESYNRLHRGAEGLLPAMLTGLSETGGPPLQPVFAGSEAERVLPGFTQRRVRALHDVRIQRFHRSAPVAGSRVLAQIGEYPLLLLKPYGEGNVMLWTTTLNMSWTNLPATPHFLPLVQDMAVFLASTVQAPINLKPGETLLYSGDAGPSASRSARATVHRPDGRSVALPLTYDDGLWLGQYADTFYPGLYEVVLPDQDPAHYTVNLDPASGQLALLEPSEEQAVGQRLNARFFSDLNVLLRRIEAEDSAKEFWQPLIVLAIIMLMLELYLATRFSR